MNTLETVEIVETEKALEKSEKTDLRSFTADFTIILHTAYSQAIFTGEWAENKIGLMQFEKYLRSGQILNKAILMLNGSYLKFMMPYRI